MRKLILTLLLLVWQALVVMDVIAFRNEPEGFNGMSWGMPAGILFSTDDFVGFNNDDKSLKYQIIQDNKSLELDNIKPYSMVFSFYKESFWKVEIESRLLQAGKLHDALIAKYGEPSHEIQSSEFIREYRWSGLITDIILVTSLNYFDRKTSDIATATIYNRKIKSTIDAEVDHTLTDRKYPIDTINGFRGKKWGSGFSKGVTYQSLEQEPFFEYLIKGDDMVFEGINAQQIRYRFYNNKAFQRVELYFSGKQNYLKLKDACFRLFGNISRYERGEIKWIGEKTTANLSFTIDSNGIWLSRLVFLGFGSQ